MRYDNEEEQPETLVSYHRKVVGKEPSYLEVHNSSVMEDLDYIIGKSSLSDDSSGLTSMGLDSHILGHGEE